MFSFRRFPTLAGTAEQAGYTIKGTNLVSVTASQQYAMIIILKILTYWTILDKTEKGFPQSVSESVGESVSNVIRFQR